MQVITMTYLLLLQGFSILSKDNLTGGQEAEVEVHRHKSTN